MCDSGGGGTLFFVRKQGEFTRFLIVWPTVYNTMSLLFDSMHVFVFHFAVTCRGGLSE